LALPVRGELQGAWASPKLMALFLLLTVLWGSSYFFTNHALATIGPMMVVLLRLGSAALLLGLLVLLRGVRLPRSWRAYKPYLLLGMLNIVVPFAMLTAAQSHVDSSMASVLSATTPLFIFVYSTLILKSDRFSWLQGMGTAVAFGGTALLFASQGGTGATGWQWPLVIVASSAVFALGNVYTQQRLGGADPLLSAFLQCAIAAVYMLPIALLVEGGFRQTPSPLSLFSVAWLGLGGSGLCYILYFYFIGVWGSNRTAMNTYLQPIVGVFLGVVVAGERIVWMRWMFLGVILAGVGIFGIARARAMGGSLPPPSARNGSRGHRGEHPANRPAAMTKKAG
jgi:drug/metabolite transporter (DMT)-like permease